MPLKLLLISVDGTVCSENKVNMDFARQLGRLARELAPHGVQTALWSNRAWTVDKQPIAAWFSQISGVEVKHHGATVDGSPARRTKDSAMPVLQQYKVEPYETALVGGSDEDMIAGVQNRLLLLRPDWYGKQTDYGFPVATIGELARFCFVFGLRRYPIFWRIKDETLDVSVAGPFSTFKAAYQMFGEDARAFAKGGQGRPDFWFNFAVSSLYFSGLLQGVDYLCSYPGHSPQSDPNKFGMAEVLARLAKCFKISFYHDLLVRHDAAPKSQPIKAADRMFITQLNTVRLDRHPHLNLSPDARKTPIKLQGKTVLVVDDFCTSGRSNETARVILESAGATVRLFSWLKTINAPYCRINSPVDIRPFHVNQIDEEPAKREHPYLDHVIAADAPAEIQQSFVRYRDWNWA